MSVGYPQNEAARVRFGLVWLALSAVWGRLRLSGVEYGGAVYVGLP